MPWAEQRELGSRVDGDPKGERVEEQGGAPRR